MSQLFHRLLRHSQTHKVLQRLYSAANTGSKEHIDKLVKTNKVVLFMKGIPDQPMCGFSNGMIQILRMHGVDNFDSYNVLEDEDLRKGLKDYSNWPTIPQLYFNGEFIGGLDIVLQMHQNGELIDELKNIEIRSLLLDQEGEAEDEKK